MLGLRGGSVVSADTLIEDALDRPAEGLSQAEMTRIIQETPITCPNCGKSNWTPVRAFNMMFRTQIGVVDETATTIYMRPETAQAIFVQYKNVMQSSRVKIPFGIAMNKGLTFRMGQTHVRRWTDDLTRRIEEGEIDPSFVITHTAPLADGPGMYRTFRNKQDSCIKVVLKP